MSQAKVQRISKNDRENGEHWQKLIITNTFVANLLAVLMSQVQAGIHVTIACTLVTMSVNHNVWDSTSHEHPL
jgi:hypothetical protein